MKTKLYGLIIWITLFLAGCSGSAKPDQVSSKTHSMSADNCKKDLACKLTSPQLRQRKATVIAQLRKEIQSSEETINGIRYKFNGTDSIIDQLADFMKTERQCCDFFIFNISVTDEKGFIWFEITGNQSVKDFIRTELEM